MNKFFKISYYILITFLIAVAGTLIISILPITGNIKILTVVSGSMEPNIKLGSVVLVKPVSDYKIGDVITFGEITKTKAPITHRIADIKISGNQKVYITKGDANNTADEEKEGNQK